MSVTQASVHDHDVFELTREALDELPYGVITLDRRGLVLRYNQAEAAFARRAQGRTVGMNFFADVAPCTNVQAFKGRFDDFAAHHDSGVDRFDFSFAFRWGRHDVSITLLRKAEHDEINVLVRGRSMATVDPAAAPVLASADGAGAAAAVEPIGPQERAASGRPAGRETGAALSWRYGSAEDARWRSRIHPDDAGLALRTLETARAQRRAYAMEYRARDEQRRRRVYVEQGTFAHDAGVVTALDVTDERAREHELWRVAHYDALTGLANRTLVLRRIEEAAREAREAGRIAAVLFMDLDRFKVVNDTFGHAVGDELLRAIALRLGECVRGGDAVARLNGDEFVVLLTDVEDVPSAERTVRRILTTISAPIPIGGRMHYVTASVGVSAAPYHGIEPIALLQAADTAMYASKSFGRNTFQWFTTEMSETIASNVQTEEELRRALERGELELYYQPIVDAASGRAVAAEALVRWNHPQRGLVMPAQFITVAERSGLIAPLGEYVLRRACRQVARWTAQGLDLRVCVNVSTGQFRQKNFAGIVRAILDETGAAPQRLELEVTESMMIDGFNETMDVLTELKVMGLRLAVDDFGTGYSSLAYLKYLPIDTLKLDRAFIADIAVDKFDRAIATAVLALAADLKLECVAEGIEEAAQMELLRELGCTRMQGYYFGRPQPVAGFDAAFATVASVDA